MQFVFNRSGFFYLLLQNTGALQMQIRKAVFETPNIEARTVPVVLASDTPVDRADYIEVLDIARADLSRGDLPLIESHDQGTVNIGLVKNIRVDGGLLRGDAIFGASARAGEILADVQGGIITGVSIGYQLTDAGQPFALADGRQATKFGFMPYELSIVAIPADTRAGFNRTLSLPKNQGPKMTSERNHAAEISTIAREMKLPAELALRSIEDGLTVQEFQKLAIKAISSSPIPTADNFQGSYMADRSTTGSVKVLRSVEQIREHFADRGGRQSGLGLADFLRGVAGMRTTELATRALAVGTDSAGGYAVPTVLMPGILEALVPASSLIQAGAGILPLSDGAKSYNFAAIDTLPTPAWRAENGAVAESGPTFKNIEIKPRSLSFMVRLSRELLHDAANIENALHQAIALAYAVEIDRAGLLGTGTAPEPRGLKNTSGIQTVTNGTDGALLAGYANILAGVEKILTVNGPMPTAAIMAPRSLVRLGGLVDTLGQPLEVPSLLSGVKLLQTSQVPTTLTVGASSDASNIFLGDFTKMYVCMRESLNVQMLTEHFADYGEVGFVCHSRIDFAVQYPQSFCLISGVR
jgi:HK97 family phage major capsid protein